TDLAPLRAADAPGFARRIGWHVVVEHEALAILALQRIDDLLVARRAERGDDHRLRLAAGKERRAVRARQQPGADRDRPHGARVASVDARLARQDLAAHDLPFELEQEIGDVVLHVAVGVGRNALRFDLLSDLFQALLTRLLLAQGVG